MDLYYSAEFVLIILLFFRLVLLLRFDKRFFIYFSDVLIYISVLFLNSLLHEIGLNEHLINRIYNLILPLNLLLAVLIGQRLKPIFTLSFIIALDFFAVFKVDIRLVPLLYAVAICAMIIKALHMISKSGKLLKVSPVYFVTATDLLFTLMSLELSQLKVDWSLSKYINIVQSISLAVFFIDVVLYHVYIRRFFII